MGKPEAKPATELMPPVVAIWEFKSDQNDDWEVPENRFSSPGSPVTAVLVPGAKMLPNIEAAGAAAAAAGTALACAADAVGLVIEGGEENWGSARACAEAAS